MDGKVLFATFSAVFMAELADKTQLVGIGMAAKSGKPLTVWLGSVLAYMLVTIISVLIGALLARFISPLFIRYLGAGLFIIIGISMLFNLL
ncbi:MAG: TMEM165/GDT1 family protein [Candidatus Omnitrophica bacterium]|nr:TMEM165/GDT1 family protein [Candidatus Omnitrophota bacterium]